MPRPRLACPLAAALLLGACGSSGPGGPSTSPASGAPAALVQVENIAAARPQWGLQQAAVVYEYVTEGGISRFSVLYTSPPPGRVGPVRSARLVTLHLAQAYGAVIVYSGASSAVQRALDGSGLPRASESSASGDLFRIAGRGAPHNLVTDGAHLSDLLARFRGQAPPAPRQLWPRSTTTSQPEGRAVSRVTVPVSASEQPVFTWNSSAAGWQRREADTGTFLDAASQMPVVAATVIVQQVEIQQTADVEDVNGQHGVDITVSGSGTAQVLTAGREYDSTWTQPASGAPRFTLVDGSAARIAPGLVWICLVPTGSPAVAG